MCKACLGCCLLALAACAQSQSVGSFRLPVPTSSTSVALMTVLAQQQDSNLVLFDTVTNSRYGTGKAQLSNTDEVVPYLFTVPSDAPLDLQLGNDVLQDQAQRPYSTGPIPAMEQGANSVVRVTLSSDGDTRVVVSSGGYYFTESAEAQPALTDNPGPLFVLDSISGDGLWLPSGFSTTPTWKDAISTYIPANPSMPLSCPAPYVSVMKTSGPTTVKVPAGTFQAIKVAEIIEGCSQPSPPDLLVYEIDRWYATGVGPVRMEYMDSNAIEHNYQLVSDSLPSNDKSYWPLGENNSWTYAMLDEAGNTVHAPVTVSVSAVSTVSFH